MRYAQVKAGQKLHLAYEPGEGANSAELVIAGHLSAPLCGKRIDENGYRMTINMPLGSACRNCIRVAKARHGH